MKKPVTVYLVVHCGYDFDPTTLAVCSTLENARKKVREHYRVKKHADQPWNGVVILPAPLDGWTPQPKDGVRSLGATKNYDKLVIGAELPPVKGSLIDLAKGAGLL